VDEHEQGIFLRGVEGRRLEKIAVDLVARGAVEPELLGRVHFEGRQDLGVNPGYLRQGFRLEIAGPDVVWTVDGLFQEIELAAVGGEGQGIQKVAVEDPVDLLRRQGHLEDGQPALFGGVEIDRAAPGAQRKSLTE
jgi:hypothetical protein